MGGVVTQMATSSGIVREAYSVPSHKDSGKTLPIPARRISFIHPGYDDPGNVLLTLPALDPGGRNPPCDCEDCVRYYRSQSMGRLFHHRQGRGEQGGKFARDGSFGAV